MTCRYWASDGTAEESHPLRLDESRIHEVDEAWVPVITPDGPAVLRHDDHPGRVAGRRPVEPGCRGAELLQAREAPLDDVPPPVGNLVEGPRTTAPARHTP